MFPQFPIQNSEQYGQFDFAWPIKQTPVYESLIQKSASGRGYVRIPLRNFPLWKFNFNIGFMMGDATQDDSAWQQFTNFYMAVFGAASDWLFQHPFDYQVTGQVIGTGDGSTTEFTMFRTLVSGGAADLIQNFINPPTIYLNGEAQGTSPVVYSIDQYGTLTFVTPPGDGVVVSWTGEFYYRCHFINDSLDSMETMLQAIWSCEQLEFESVLL